MIFEIIAEMLLSSFVYKYFSRRRARKRYACIVAGGSVTIPGRLKLQPGLTDDTDVNFTLSQSGVSAETMTGLPRTFRDLLPDSAGIQIKNLGKDIPWRDEAAFTYVSEGKTVAIFCRPQDLPVVALALGHPVSDPSLG